MKEENQHIDELFRDSLSTYEVSPPEESWNAILTGLEKSRRKKTLIFLMRAAAIGLIILGLGTAINYLAINKTLPNNHITINESGFNTNRGPKTDTIKDEIAIINTKGSDNATLLQNSKTIADHHSDIPASQVKNSGKSVNKTIAEINTRPERPEKIALPEVQNPKINNSRNTDNQPAPLLALRIHSIESIQTTPINIPGLAGNSLNTITVPVEKEVHQRWSVGGQATPLYAYREIYPSGNTTLSQEYFNDVETPIISYSGGLNLSYKASHRLSIESGVYYARLGQHLNNVYLYQRDQLNVGETYQKAGTRVVPVVNSHGPIVSVNKEAGAEENLLGNRNVTLFNNALGMSS